MKEFWAIYRVYLWLAFCAGALAGAVITKSDIGTWKDAAAGGIFGLVGIALRPEATVVIKKEDDYE